MLSLLSLMIVYDAHAEVDGDAEKVLRGVEKVRV